jgi:hypothetical protein
VAEALQPIGAFTRPEGPQGALQFARVECGNVAKDRWLWALHFQKPYTFANTTLILYLDADNNPQTGRRGVGCEVMFTHSLGQGGLDAYAPDGGAGEGVLPRVALHNGVLYLCVDCPLKQENGQSVFRYSLLSETQVPHVSVDSTGAVEARGPPNRDRKVVLTVDGIVSDEGFLKTEGLDLIWGLQADPANVCFRSPEAELSNLRYYDAEYRWWAVYGASGSMTVTVPRAGSFFPAVVVYDGGGAETYQMLVDGKAVGHFVAAEDDRRQRVHFLDRALAFKGGEKLMVRVGSVGSHVTEDLMLLAQQPPVRGRTFALQQLESGLARVEGTDALRLTWISTWPAACTVEYWGADRKVVTQTEPEAVANHRVYLEGLQPGATYGYRILAPKPDGGLVRSPDQTAGFSLPKPLDGTATAQRVALRVENPYDVPIGAASITMGVPFAQSELGDPAHVRLLGDDGKEQPVQVRPTAYWLDGSIKWLLVSYLTRVGARQTVTSQLEYGTRITRKVWGGGSEIGEQGQQLTVNTGPLRVSFDLGTSPLPAGMALKAGAAWEPIGGALAATLTAADGTPFGTGHAPERTEIEENGPVRTVVKMVGHHQDATGKPFMAYILRHVFYAGLPYYRLFYTFGNDEAADVTAFKGLSLTLPVASSTWTTSVDGQIQSGADELSLRQMEDNACLLGNAGRFQRGDGWVDVAGGGAGLLVAVRDFWQQYPKGFAVTTDGVRVDLCPQFPAGTYDAGSKLDEVKLYYYLKGGEYKLRQGVQKQHELLIYPHRGQALDEVRQEAGVFQEPLIAVCTPERYCDTKVFGEILPATSGRAPEYERICENVYRAYTRNRESERNYGMLNFGDQFGERKVNWANGEYDHHHAFLMQFIRTAERRWYFLGEKAARHAIDVDTCHYGPRRGGEWIHAMGHTGGYFSQQYEGNGIPGGGFSASHTWSEGFCDWYALSGDTTAAENAALVADHYDGAYLNHYDFSNCRDNGWHLLLTMAAYRATADPYYLNAARIIVERTLERQSPEGGWVRQMVPGHCLDLPRHRGEANFMLGVLANGLEQYYDELHDPRVAQAILGGARQAVREMWVPEVNGFRYTSCPNMKGYTANNDMTAEVLFFAYRLGGEPQYGEIAMRALGAAFRDGIGSIAHLRWTPHLIYNADLLKQKGFAFTAERVPVPQTALPADLAKLAPERLVRVEAEDFVDQGLDTVQVFERAGNRGKMISYWEKTPGHWLEWTLPVKTAGDYVIYLKYCSGAASAPRRGLRLDGQAPGPAFAEMSLPLTGGFCTDADNWAYHAAGDGQPVRLEAGEHRLRLTNLGGGVGLDYVLLVRR